jgi:hypothetical protein
MFVEGTKAIYCLGETEEIVDIVKVHPDSITIFIHSLNKERDTLPERLKPIMENEDNTKLIESMTKINDIQNKRISVLEEAVISLTLSVSRLQKQVLVDSQVIITLKHIMEKNGGYRSCNLNKDDILTTKQETDIIFQSLFGKSPIK